VGRPINLPEDLAEVVATLQSELQLGRLEEVLDQPPPEFFNWTPLKDAGDLPYPSDFIQLVVRCTSCGRKYLLFCETYHGGGGTLRPLEYDHRGRLRYDKLAVTRRFPQA
jgi:hypothetical protein